MKQTELILLRGFLPGQEEVCRIADEIQKSARAVYQHEAGCEKPEQNQYAGDSTARHASKHQRKYPGTEDKVAANVQQLPRKHASKVTPQATFGVRLDLRTLGFCLQPFAFDRVQLSQQLIPEAFLGHSMRVPLDATVSKEVASARRNFNQDMSSNANNFNHA
ncbi:hypothetical protein J5N58_18315 [Rhizobium cremeum]|uniref:hypothetical protein n=1 Tax=Rhizobium cremeum TaxID=2813827 RepID=UPI001FCFC694|nr:hypothetical protein [Rhizobium cremeum]MCJ7996379.1 hypothetical protein [Rhizobium cremeum]MCJ8001638.1 hypothetical protein [Rhizobium cremeum]